MTYLVAGLIVVCLGVAGQLVLIASDLTAAKAWAQAAADAAALAAIAESVPFAAARPRDQALEFARANRAQLLECLCEPGATAMQVTVSIDGIRAIARAVFDPDLLQPAIPDPGAGPGSETSG